MFRQFTFRDFPLCIDFQYKSNKRALDLENFNQERLKEEGRKMILVEGPSRATKSLLQDLSVLLEKVETLDYPKERKVSEIQEFVKLREIILSIFVIQCGEIEEDYCQENYGLYAREKIYNLNRRDIDATDEARRKVYHDNLQSVEDVEMTDAVELPEEVLKSAENSETEDVNGTGSGKKKEKKKKPKTTASASYLVDNDASTNQENEDQVNPGGADGLEPDAASPVAGVQMTMAPEAAAKLMMVNAEGQTFLEHMLANPHSTAFTPVCMPPASPVVLHHPYPTVTTTDWFAVMDERIKVALREREPGMPGGRYIRLRQRAGFRSRGDGSDDNDGEVPAYAPDSDVEYGDRRAEDDDDEYESDNGCARARRDIRESREKRRREASESELDAFKRQMSEQHDAVAAQLAEL